MDFKMNILNEDGFDIGRYKEMSALNENLDTADYSPYFKKKQRFNSIDFSKEKSFATEFKLPLIMTKKDMQMQETTESIYAPSSKREDMIFPQGRRNS